MSATKYILGALGLLAIVSVMGTGRSSKPNAPLAIAALARSLSCIEDHLLYRGLVMSCDSSVAFADIRKLDMRADNHARSQGTVRIQAARP
jgi:hypothetical protein